MAETRASLELRPAVSGDVDAIVELSSGPIAGKRTFITDSLVRRTMLTACSADRILGYIIWDRAFFGRPFVWLLGVGLKARRQGIAVRLMRAFEQSHPGEALFTSTNESNHAMHCLLATLDFVPSGRVENLDPGDPEIFFFKVAAG